MPRVSILIPAYDAAATIEATISSVQAQTYHDLEVLVVDDGSRDATPAVVAAVADPRIRLIRKRHAGVAHALNVALEESVGELVSFLDADDLWTPEKVADQVGALDADPDADVAYSLTLFVDEQARFLFAQDPSIHRGDVLAELLVDNFLASGSNALARREALAAAGPFDPTVIPAHDLDLWLRVAARSSFTCVPRYQVLYRVQRGSLSSDVQRMEAAMRVTHARAFAAGPAALREVAEVSRAGLELYAAYLFLTRAFGPGARRAAGRRLWRALAAHPPTILSRRFLVLAIGWMALLPVPAGLVPTMVREALIASGWTARLQSPTLRAGVAKARAVAAAGDTGAARSA